MSDPMAETLDHCLGEVAELKRQLAEANGTIAFMRRFIEGQHLFAKMQKRCRCPKPCAFDEVLNAEQGKLYVDFLHEAETELAEAKAEIASLKHTDGKHFYCHEDKDWYVVKGGRLMAANGPPD